MRANWSPRIASGAGRCGLLLLLTFTIAGCKTEKDPDDPTILGVPPSEAYLGVEYYYNFGAYGGEGILEYSLTNAPSWLALEDTNNKARQGIIIRGVPGLTGGSRGRADLGETENINLVTNDGQQAGTQPFDVEVKENVLSLNAEDFVEGAASEVPEARDYRCDVPELEETGSHTYTRNVYDAAGKFETTKQVTEETYPVIVKVRLDQPSVTRVGVAFELDSSYNPDSCDEGIDLEDSESKHQRCEYGRSNRGEAIIGKDIVGLGTGSESSLPVPDYLVYQEDDDGYLTKGVITLEPGITECYIRLEVVEDTVPEPLETLNIRLTEVREGLAGLGSSNSGVRSSLRIEDNEPSVRVETLKEGTRDAMNLGSTREYRAILTGERSESFKVKLGAENGINAVLDTDFFLEVPDGEGGWKEGKILTFPESNDEARFRIRTVDSASYTNNNENDRAILLGVDERYQDGRPNFARAEEGADRLRVNINELDGDLVVGQSGQFFATDMVSGHNGRYFVTGYNQAQNNRVEVRVYTQKGALEQTVIFEDALPSTDAPPVIGFVERVVEEGNSDITRHEFVISFGTTGALPGETSSGGMDLVTVLYFFDSAQSPGTYTEVWRLQSGTAGDDIPRWAGIDEDSGYVAIAGETSGDSLLQRIDTKQDGNTVSAIVAWTRQVGSSGDKSVAGGSVDSNSPVLFGSSSGTVDGQPTFGGKDIFFYSAASKDSTISVYQRGSEADETVTDGLYSGTTLWLLGNSPSDFAVQADEDGGDRNLERKPLSSKAGFILGYTLTGTLARAVTLNDEADGSAEAFQALTLFDEDLVAGGSSNGDFAGSFAGTGTNPIVARVAPSADDEESPATDWRQQLEISNASVVKLANYRDDEITALVEETISGSDQWRIILLTGEGRRLN